MPGRHTEQWPHNLPHPLTSFIGREREIAEGMAANHVKHILARLTLDSRVQIATWAIERRLHLPSSA
jgi:hypothetical protein